MRSTVLELAGFVATVIASAFVWGPWAALLAVGLVVMVVGYMVGGDE